MDSSEESRRKIGTFFLLIVLTALVFFLLRPILLAAVAGLILSYIFNPFYIRMSRIFRNRTFSAILVVVIVAIVVIAPLWFVTPILIEQVFSLFTQSQHLDSSKFIEGLFPTASQQFTAQLVVTFNNIISSSSSVILNWLVTLIFDPQNPTQFILKLINLAIIALAFFFGMRDSDLLAKFVSDISPLARSKEKIMVQKFKDITDSIVFGQIIVGIAQGILAGIGLFAFGIENAFVLTLLAIFFSVIPFIGPALLWIPITIFLFSSGNTGVAIAFLLYNVFIVSTIDNVLRAYIVSRKTKISQSLMLIGMIGGILLFGILGLILGPLILAYFIMFLELYRNKKLYTAFID